MKKTAVSILFLCLFTLFTAHAQDLRTLFINMPDTIIPTLSRSERMDFLDYMDSGMKARAANKLGGESVMTALSDRMLSITTSGAGKFDMVLFPRKKGSDLICIIYTVTARYEDSRLAFYDVNWQPIDREDLITMPVFDDYLTKEALKHDSIADFRKQSLLRLQSVTPNENTLEFRYTSLDYLGDKAESYRSWLKSDPLIYIWTGKRFKLKK